jgi:hypothetical protein
MKAASRTQHEGKLEERVYRRAAGFVALARAAAECFGGTHMPDLDPAALRNVVRDLKRAVRSIKGAYVVIIGGLAVQELGYERYTKDVAAVVDSGHYGQVLAKLRESGYELTPQFFLKHRLTGAKLDLLREGTKMKDSREQLPHPRELGPNLGFATLPAVIRLKLEAHRRQDLADVVGLLKARPQDPGALAGQLPDHLRAEFLVLAEEARREAGR